MPRWFAVKVKLAVLQDPPMFALKDERSGGLWLVTPSVYWLRPEWARKHFTIVRPATAEEHQTCNAALAKFEAGVPKGHSLTPREWAEDAWIDHGEEWLHAYEEHNMRVADNHVERMLEDPSYYAARVA